MKVRELRELLEKIEDGSAFDDATVCIIAEEADKYKREIDVAEILRLAADCCTMVETYDANGGLQVLESLIDKYGEVKGVYCFTMIERVYDSVREYLSCRTPSSVYREYMAR